MKPKTKPVLVIISANAEWRVVVQRYPRACRRPTPYGEYFEKHLAGRRVLFFHGGWGKISAAASAEYALQRWQPGMVVNLGTCGGFAGQIQPGEIVLASETVVHDILEQMGDADEARAFYSSAPDLSWLPQTLPLAVRPGRLVSADHDILPQEIPWLVEKFGAVAADWESGAIAWVAQRHGVRCLVLRGVTDLVGAEGGEAYGNLELFQQRTGCIITSLLESLPGWLS